MASYYVSDQAVNMKNGNKMQQTQIVERERENQIIDFSLLYFFP